MENILSKRIKHLVAAVLIFSLFLAVFLLLRRNPSNSLIQSIVQQRIQKLEQVLEGRIQQVIFRSRKVYQRYRENSIRSADMKPRESLVVMEEGKISRYFGEVFFLSLKSIPLNQWVLINKKEWISLIKRLDENVYYTAPVLRLDEKKLFDILALPFSLMELKFSETADTNVNRAVYDKNKKMFFYSRVLRFSNNQLTLHLRLPKSRTHDYFNRGRILFLFLFGAVLLVFLGVFLRDRIGRRASFLVSLMCFGGLLIVGLQLVKRFVTPHLSLRILFVHFSSIYQCLIVSLFVYWVLYVATRRIKSAGAGLVVYNILVGTGLYFSISLLEALDFFFASFNFHPQYLSFMVILLIWHLMPVTAVRKVELPRTIRSLLQVVLIQVPFILAYFFLWKFDGIILLYLFFMSGVMVIALFMDWKFVPHTVILFMISISVSLLISKFSYEDNREFVSQYLKNVFSNQKVYGKFIAHEIVKELNNVQDEFKDFFREDKKSVLEKCWRNSFASRDNIASGIFVVSREGEVVNSFSYQIPYLRMKSKNLFPFWAIENTTAELYGELISLAAASISIFSGEDYLGDIVVQVLDSPELILKDQEKINIFTLDRKILGSNFSYIKLNEKNQIVENPSNINLRNISGILEYNNQWIRFRFMNIMYHGYIFRFDKNSVIVFFPIDRFISNISELVEIFLFFMAFLLLFYSKDLKLLRWRDVYYSFSMRVFLILIVISLFTAVIFSLFSLNFNSRSQERQFQHIIYQRGRTAENIGNNLIDQDGELTQNHIFLLSRILNSDLSLYQDGELQYTSNYRKIIQSQIPLYLHSHYMELLNVRNQKFVLINNDGISHLYFKVAKYVFDLEVPFGQSALVSDKKYYVDFLLALFFILASIGFTIAFIFRNKIVYPINELNQGMSDVEKGHLRPLDRIPSETEIKSLYVGFNSMVEGIKEQKKNVSEISRMKTLIKLGRRVAHEIKNPLTPIKLSAEQILRSIKDKGEGYENIIKRSVQFIIDESNHLKKVSYGFLDLSRMDELNVQAFDFLEIIEEEIFVSRQIYQKVVFELHCEKNEYKVYWDKVKIKQVLRNLLNNSIEAIGKETGRIEIRIKSLDDQIVFEIADNGMGMTPVDIENAFDVDYSTKDVGTGLGLFIVKRILELHHGKIHIKSEKSSGTTVTMELPVDLRGKVKRG